MSNRVRLDHKIFVTKILECDGSLVFFNEVSNWPNGFFYLFSGVVVLVYRIGVQGEWLFREWFNVGAECAGCRFGAARAALFYTKPRNR